jgi:predicted nucleic acid-binding protein
MLERALGQSDLHRLYGLSFRDAPIVRGALNAGCAGLYPEASQEGRRFEGLQVANPFAPS